MILETHDNYPYNKYKKEIELIKSLEIIKLNLKVTDKDINDKELIIKYFNELADIYYKLNDRFRADSYYEAVYRIKKIHIIPKTKKELMKIEGIGDGISHKILEIINTKKLTYLDNFKKDKKINALISLLKISGIGVKKALSLIEDNITNYDELESGIIKGEVKLTNAQELGVMYYDDLNKKIPYKEVVKLEKYLLKYKENKNKGSIEIVGRRGKKEIGDIDILVVDYNMGNILSYIEKKFKIIGFITKGKKKSSFLIKIDKIVRHVDILITNMDSYIPALLYFTGSKYFNIEIRNIAKQKGYKLNEYNLKKDNKIISVASEEDIFNLLGIDYIEPKYR